MEPSERSTSFWKEEVPPIEAPALAESTTADVCVIGAGIAGLSAAYLIQRSGADVVVLDRGPIGGGETGQTTAHLASAMDDRFQELERLFGREGARLAWESHAAAIDTMEAIVRGEGIDCGFERLDGYLFLGPGQRAELLEAELLAAQRAGFPGVARLDRAPLELFDTGPCLRFPEQAMFHPMRYLAGLCAALRRDGCRLHTGSMVSRVEGGDTPRVFTREGLRVSAAKVIVATNSPINDRLAIHAKQAPYRTYVVAMSLPAGSVPAALYWDMEDPYHYVRLHRGVRGNGELLIVGGEDHKTGERDDAAARYARLEAWARARFPMVGETRARWSGQVMEPMDGLGFIGTDPEYAENVYVATGDSGQGMTHGTLAGVILTDLIAGRENPWAELYSPRRRTLRAAREYARENLKVASHYAEWLRREPRTSADQIPRGSGAVLQRGRHKVAVYRDEAGALHERSAVCTHLGCVVRWNGAEKSWDCPCHGSRFAPTGEMIHGPAAKALREAPEVEAEERVEERRRKAG